MTDFDRQSPPEESGSVPPPDAVQMPGAIISLVIMVFLGFLIWLVGYSTTTSQPPPPEIAQVPTIGVSPTLTPIPTPTITSTLTPTPTPKFIKQGPKPTEVKVKEEELNLCEVDTDCIIVAYRHCCGLTKRAINKKYEALYKARPEWQKFDDPETCAVIGRCPDDSKINKTICQNITTAVGSGVVSEKRCTLKFF